MDKTKRGNENWKDIKVIDDITLKGFIVDEKQTSMIITEPVIINGLEKIETRIVQTPFHEFSKQTGIKRITEKGKAEDKFGYLYSTMLKAFDKIREINVTEIVNPYIDIKKYYLWHTSNPENYPLLIIEAEIKRSFKSECEGIQMKIMIAPYTEE